MKALTGNSYENTEGFQELVTERLLALIRIGAGQYPYEGATVESVGLLGLLRRHGAPVILEETSSVAVPVSAAEGDGSRGDTAAAGEIVMEAVSVPGGDPVVWQYGTDAGEEKQLSPEQLERIAEDWQQKYEKDRNLLYEVKRGEEVLCGNLNGEAFGGPEEPVRGQEMYDFFLEFDGTAVRAWRNGLEEDIYGDGIYESAKGDWRVPGYRNYPVPEAWKDCRVTLAVSRTPLLYLDGEMRYGYEFYYLETSFQSDWEYLIRWGILTACGLLCLCAALLCRRERKNAKRALGARLGKLPIELRLLFLLLLLAASAGGTYGIGLYMYGWTEVPVAYCVGLAAAVIFWSVWLFAISLCYGGRVRDTSLTVRAARYLSVKDADLSVQKRLEKPLRTALGLLGGTVAAAVGALVRAWCFGGGMNVSAERVFFTYGDGNGWVFSVMTVLLGLLLLLCLFRQLVRQKRLAKDLGILSDQIDAAYEGKEREKDPLPADSDLARMSEKVEGIHRGIHRAVEERMKSERMKVELVTNVSHDIKTPLTSIISYVDLLQKSEELSPELRDYVAVLAQKSERLRAMVQDVFEVSKAASGQLSVEPERLDLGKLLRQTLADMQGQIDAATVSLRERIPAEPVMIRADGQRLYRVFQNLLQNALQYSLTGSRVYLTLETKDGAAVVTVRNTSAYELKEDVDFTERFVRGDESRTDGGSGLGLSIARSFTEACGGTFRVEVIADLFVATVTFVLEA